MKTVDYKSQQLTRVANNLYRNGEDMYYARLYKNGKQHKKCLNTHDRKMADRKLVDFEKEVERKSQEIPDLLFEELATQWLGSIKVGLVELGEC